MLNDEVDDEEKDPKVVENGKVQSDPMPTITFPLPFPQRLKKEGG